MGLREKIFLGVAGVSARLPAFRGRTRIFLLLFNALGLGHVKVQKRLTHPTAFTATLDLGSWLQRLAYLTGGYEADTVRFLARLHQVRPGYLLDVGANVGLICIPFAMISGRVVAFEAVHDNFLALKENVCLNGLQDRVTLFDQALGDENKTVDIQVEGDLGAGEGTGTANILAEGSTWNCVRISISIRRLDEMSVPVGCSVIKIDTDGYDLKVLQGAEQFISANRPLIYGEFAAHCMAWHGQKISDVAEWAALHQYEMLFKAPNQFLFSRHSEAYVQDLLLAPTERLKDIAWCLS